MILSEGTLQFHFDGALNAFKFDEQDRTAPAFHGLSHCMKAVDFIVEYEDYYLFVEVKNPPHKGRYASASSERELVKNLTTKFRDSFLYRWAEGKVNKPVHYQCLVEMDNAQTLHLMNQLKKALPAEKTPPRWRFSLADVCVIANQDTWNMAFPNMQVT